MKTLSSFNQTAADAPIVDVIRLFKIEFPGSSPVFTVYLCDRPFGSADAGYCKFNSQIYEPLVLKYDTIRLGRVDARNWSVEPAETAIDIDNSIGLGGYNRFSEIFGDYYPQFAIITISEIFNGASSASDAVEVFKGTIEDITNMRPDALTLRLSGHELAIANKFDHTICDTDDFSGADPDDVGKMIPVVYGSAKRVPALAVDAGGKTTLAEDITDTDPTNSGTLEVTDGSHFPTGSFVIQVNYEKISIASRSGNTLTLAASGARGYDSTDAADHNQGDHLAEVKTSYIYLVADHPVDAINDVYVDGIRQDSSDYTAYTGQGGSPPDQKSGYGARAVIEFTTLPKITKQINVEVDDSSLAVTDTGHDHATSSPSTSNFTAEFQTHTVAVNTVTNPANLYDGSSATQASFSGSSGGVPAYVWCKRTSDLSGTSGTPKRWRIGLHTGSLIGGTVSVNCYGLNAMYQFITPSENTLHYSSWYNCATQSWSWVNTQLKRSSWCYVKPLNTTTTYKYIKRFFIQIEYETAATYTQDGVSAVAISGGVTVSGNSSADVVIGRVVSADLDGIIDDGSIVGSPAGQLIERPDHVLTHILTSRCGLSTDEINATKYAAAGTIFASLSFKLAFAILSRPNVRLLLNRCAIQACAIEYWESGKHCLDFRDEAGSSPSISADKSIEASRIDLNQFYIRYTARSDLANKVTARFDRYWSGYVDEVEADRNIIVEENSASQAIFGVVEKDSLSIPYCQQSAQAQKIVDDELANKAYSRIEVEFVGGHYFTDLERGDIINFVTSDDDEYFTECLLGLVNFSSDYFRVIDMQRRNDHSIQITAVKVIT